MSLIQIHLQQQFSGNINLITKTKKFFMKNKYLINLYENSFKSDQINQGQSQYDNLLVQQSQEKQNQRLSKSSCSNQSKTFAKYVTPAKGYQTIIKQKNQRQSTIPKMIRPFQRENEFNNTHFNGCNQIDRLKQVIQSKNLQIKYLQQTIDELNNLIKKIKIKQKQSIYLQKKNIQKIDKVQTIQDYFENQNQLSLISYKYIQKKKQVNFLKQNNQQLYQKMKQQEGKNKQLQSILQRSFQINAILQCKIQDQLRDIQIVNRTNFQLTQQKNHYLRNQQKQIKFIKKMKKQLNKSCEKSNQTLPHKKQLSQNKENNSTATKSIVNQSTIISRQKSKTILEKVYNNQLDQYKNKLQKNCITKLLLSKIKI